jgi:periplasmic divalent cation tolerance protein
MVFYYITLNTNEEARQISRDLFAQKLAVCANWFPITCAYVWEGEVHEEPEIVLILKTQAGYRSRIESVIQSHITYNNCIAEWVPNGVNAGFQNWLNSVVPFAGSSEPDSLEDV